MHFHKKKYLLLLSCIPLFLTGCTSAPTTTTDGQAWDADWLKIGTKMGVEVPRELTLLENKEVLAAEGLYYVTWVTGSSVPYENSDGDTVDLYDAQLYLLAGEATDEEKARQDCAAWLAASKENYDVQTEETITCGGQDYTMITYRCIGEDTPYDRGASAYGTCGVTAVCAEFTCTEDFEGDLVPLLTEFLDGCHYSAR